MEQHLPGSEWLYAYKKLLNHSGTENLDGMIGSKKPKSS
jgi:hypothetical protein